MNWTKEEVTKLYEKPLMELIYEAVGVHKKFHKVGAVQMSSLISIKTGGCPEDCSYCPQAARYSTGVSSTGLMSLEEVKLKAKTAKEKGVTRVCLGAAWREVKDGEPFDNVLKMVKEIAEEDLEVCCTLGMLNEDQAQRLKEAGLKAYNHNIDSSEKFYKSIITTRDYEQRLDTHQNVRKANISLCSGGIIGMGESSEDHIDFLLSLANMNPCPESVPINRLIPVEGTPLGERKSSDIWEWVRMIALSRILMPKSMVRLSAGREGLSPEAQALCFLAGANSIFVGEKLLTAPNPDEESDSQLFHHLGLKSFEGNNARLS